MELKLESLTSPFHRTYGESITLSGTASLVEGLYPYRLAFVLGSDKIISRATTLNLKTVKAKVDNSSWYTGTVSADSFTVSVPAPRPEPLIPITCRLTLYLESDNGETLTVDSTDEVWGIKLQCLVDYMIPTIIDRTRADVDFITHLHNAVVSHTCTEIEYTQYTQIDWRGAINESDLERIESNILVLCKALDISVTIPKHTSPITATYFTWLVGVVKVIRDKWSAYATTPKVPKQPLNTYKKWNELERILYDVYRNLMSNFYYHCGSSVYSGGNIGLLE